MLRNSKFSALVLFAVAACALPWALSPAAAAADCQTYISRGSRADEHFVILGPVSVCRRLRIIFARHPCSLVWSGHLATWVKCGEEIVGYAGVWDRDFSGHTFGEKTDPLPPHEQARQTWLAPIDEEGLLAHYPVDFDHYRRLYPRTFLSEGQRIELANPSFRVALQTHVYETMSGEKRAAVSGEASVGCASLYFVEWSTPGSLEATEGKMRTLLESLRVEDVLPGQNPEHLCRPN